MLVSLEGNYYNYFTYILVLQILGYFSTSAYVRYTYFSIKIFAYKIVRISKFILFEYGTSFR